MKMVAIIKDTFVLFIITFILVLSVAFVKVSIQDIVDASNNAAAMKAYVEVCPDYASSENIQNDVVGASAGFDASLNGDDAVLRCKNSKDEIIGYIVKCTSKGFGGPLNLIVGFDKSAKITGVRYAETPKETPGIGMKTTEMPFLNSWVGHSSNDVSTVDTISGATVSSTAFKEAMSLACMFANRAATMDGGI